MMVTRTKQWMTAICLVAGLTLCLAGCNTNQGPNQLQLAQTQFQQGDYARAQVTAARAANTAGGRDRDLANYLAGISAYRLGNMTGAERYLSVASRSGDESLAADASATLGLIYSQQQQYAAAANAFMRGASLQEGEDRAQGYFYAGVAQQKLGQWPQARTSLLLARKSTSDKSLIDRIDEQLAVTGYTVQIGAFADRTNADNLASQYAGKVASAKLGSVYVTPGTTADGRTLNQVQIGRFATFGAASHAKTTLGLRDAVIVPLQR